MPLLSLVSRRRGQDAFPDGLSPQSGSRPASGADRSENGAPDGRRGYFHPCRAWGRMITATKVVVVDNQIEPALKALKKQMQKDGLFQEMKRRVAYDKPSVKRKRKQAAARKKRRKAMRRMERDSD